MPKEKHFHKAARIKHDLFNSCVGMTCNPESHEGLTLQEDCDCGQRRFINFNENRHGRQAEYGTWHFSHALLETL